MFKFYAERWAHEDNKEPKAYQFKTSRSETPRKRRLWKLQDESDG